MLTQIDVVYENELGLQALALPILGLTTKDSLLLRKVTGLEPPDINLFIGDYARDGGTYQGRRVGKRNVVLTIDLNPNPALGQTVKGLRELLYQIFMDPLVDADHVQLTLRSDDAALRYVVGYAEKFEGEIFGSDTMVQISLICVDPFIRDVALTEFETATGWVNVPFNYKGTAGAGFATEIKLTNTASVLTLDNNGRKMVFTYDFQIGDVVNINTAPGSRSVTVTRGGVVASLLAALTPSSPWLELRSSNNTLRVYGIDSSTVVGTIMSLSYRAAYWGV